ncbi:MAG TPA: NAD(P)/FAD-dependent oxidoreductase [Actinomycetes bacterium]|nr:NAD(P)/FAD-dependent oxidoreductase [Actinomycetes bacterium]
MASTHDVIVVGGGHNGLVAAFYLAKAGLRPLVLERRPFVGGACVTETFAPGFRASTGAYVLSMLREAIWRDCRLAERGLVVDPAGPSLHVFDRGGHLYVDDDLAVTTRNIAEFSEHDATALQAFEEDLGAIAGLVTPMIDWTPPSTKLRTTGLRALARLGSHALKHRGQVIDAGHLFATSATQLLEQYFESEQVKAAFGWHAINDSVLGPSDPGTAYVLLHDHASEETGAGVRSWGFVRGGIGRVTEMLADAAIEAGATIRTDSEVDEILVRAGRAYGVRLADGSVLTSGTVLSNADPQRTFLDLVPEGSLPQTFESAIRAYRIEGTSMKITLGVSGLPHVRGLGGGEQPYHRGIMEISGWLSDLDRAQAQAKQGIPGDDPHIEVCFPTVHDPSLAPAGHHVVTIDVNSQPYTLAEGHWDDIKEKVADAAVSRLAEFMPDLPDLIVHRQVLSPLDLERLFGMTGGHALHGDMSFDQLFAFRPVRGWADYRTPVGDLYLCGAGTHPGGGVTGANGRNCAREVLRDLGRTRRTHTTGART